MTVEAGKSNICRVGKEAGDPGKNDVAVQVQRQSRGRIDSLAVGDLSLSVFS